MHLSSLTPEIALKWGVRALYLNWFIVLVMAFGRWDNPQTFSFVGAISCLVFSALVFVREEEEEIAEPNDEATIGS